MRSIKKTILWFAFGTVLCSCSTSHVGTYSSSYLESNKISQEYTDVDVSITASESKAETNKKIISSATINLIVKEIDTTIVKLENLAKSMGGYVNESGTYVTTIRVKSDNFKVAMDSIETFGKVQKRQVSGVDVTSEYLDYQIRLDNAMKSRERYLQLLAKAENVTAALLVEKELERLNEVIELLKGNMNRINHLSDYSTITVYLQKKVKPGVLGYLGIGLYKSVAWLFVRN